VSAAPAPGGARVAIPWASSRYSHVAVKQPLTDLLREFAADQGLSLVLSDGVAKLQTAVSGTYQGLSPEAFLDRVTRENGLTWFFDGTSLFVYRLDELVTRFLRLDRTTPAQVLDVLVRIGLPVDRLALRPVDDHVLYIVGPPRLMEIVDQTIKTLEGAGPTRQLGVMFFQLSFVRGIDVAQVIAPLLSRDGVITVTPPAQEGLGAFAVPGLSSPGLAPLFGAGGMGYGGSGAPALSGSTTGNALGAPAPVDNQVEPAGGGRQVITASAPDTSPTGGNSLAGLDTLIVRDDAEHLASICEAVKRLDVQPLQVLIEAVILSVELDNSQELGINFATINDNARFATVSGNGALINAAGGFPPGRVLINGTTPKGKTVSTGQLVAGYTGLEQGLKLGFITSNVSGFIRAIETTNKIDVLATPRILVLNKQRAAIQLGQRLGFRNTVTNLVSSLQVVQFLSIGTLLALRPFVTGEGLIRMEIHPEKSTGQLDASGIPQTNTTELTTNILVPDGATIVIGGLMDNSDTVNESGVLGLARLPVVGPLFRSRLTATTKRELVVLLTPRVLRRDGLPPPVPGFPPKNGSGVPNSGPMPGPALFPPPVAGPVAFDPPAPAARAAAASPGAGRVSAPPSQYAPPAAPGVGHSTDPSAPSKERAASATPVDPATTRAGNMPIAGKTPPAASKPDARTPRKSLLRNLFLRQD
jgi:type II secretory pathway component GspD/PulD (secretin)